MKRVTSKPQPSQVCQTEALLLLGATGNASWYVVGEAVELTQ